MPFLLAALAVFGVLVWLGRQTRLGRGDWRVGAALLSLGSICGAAACALHGQWAFALVFLAAGGFFLFDIRRRGARSRPARDETALPGDGRMSAAAARAVLGVGADADEKAIQAAYLRLMRSVHPDRGGTTGLAAQLNAARERLLQARGRGSR